MLGGIARWSPLERTFTWGAQPAFLQDINETRLKQSQKIDKQVGCEKCAKHTTSALQPPSWKSQRATRRLRKSQLVLNPPISMFFVIMASSACHTV